MNAMWTKALLLAVVVPLAGMCLTDSPSVGQEKPAARKEPKGRLPAYYSGVVSDEQKEKIYTIQGKYADQLKALNEQVLALVKKQNDEIEGVLTSEQKEKIDMKRVDAAAKKKKKGAAKIAEAEAEPAATKTGN